MQKYLFTVLYKDGSVYHQNQEDKSEKQEGKSCFYDVDLQNVKEFRLHNNIGFFSVDLETGLFATNTGTFGLSEGNDYSNRKLIYFRRVTKDFNITGTSVSENITYFLGWQAEDANGKSVQHTIAIK